jgi:hypothetical protein
MLELVKQIKVLIIIIQFSKLREFFPLQTFFLVFSLNKFYIIGQKSLSPLHSFSFLVFFSFLEWIYFCHLFLILREGGRQELKVIQACLSILSVFVRFPSKRITIKVSSVENGHVYGVKNCWIFFSFLSVILQEGWSQER